MSSLIPLFFRNRGRSNRIHSSSTSSTSSTTQSRFRPSIINLNLQSAQQLAPQSAPITNQVCIICYKDISAERKVYVNRCSCGLIYCKNCIFRWVMTNQNSCPTCRKQIFKPKTVQRIKHIYSIYTMNKTPITDKSITNLIQFFENVETQRNVPLK